MINKFEFSKGNSLLYVKYLNILALSFVILFYQSNLFKTNILIPNYIYTLPVKADYLFGYYFQLVIISLLFLIILGTINIFFLLISNFIEKLDLINFKKIFISYSAFYLVHTLLISLPTIYFMALL